MHLLRLLRPAIAGLLLAAGVCAAAAAPLVPASELPGRERDRFTDSPVERFMRPGPIELPQVISPAAPQCGAGKSSHSKSRSSRRKGC
jgi:hypothetical protein